MTSIYIYLPLLVHDVIPLVHLKPHPPVSVDCLTHQLQVTLLVIVHPVFKYSDVQIAQVLTKGGREGGREAKIVR